MEDILIDSTGDLMLAGDDLVIGFSDNQHREHLLTFEKGVLKQYPEAGVGLATFLESEDPVGLFREIAIQFSADGMQVEKIGFDENGKLLIKAPYKQA